MPTILKILGHFRAKNFVLWSLSLPLNVKQRSNELRWLVRVGMFSQNECLLQNSLEISCMKIFPSADVHEAKTMGH